MTVPQPLTPQQRDELAEVLRTADHCHGIVTRDFKQDACGKPPVAIIDGAEWDEDYWPACAYHAHRYGGGRCVPLSSLARLLADERAEAAREALSEAADKWTQGAWSDVMLPKPTPPAVPVIAYSNRVGDWLRSQAARIARGDER